MDCRPSIRVLHLEDNERDADLIRSMLEADGLACDIACADSRERFEAALAGGAFDVILCDHDLRGFDGLSAVKLARQAQPDAPVIVVAGDLSSEDAVRCMQAGAIDYILKQRLDRFVPAVRRALREGEEYRKRTLAEQALRESEAKFRGLIEQSLAGIFIVQEGKLAYVNPRFAEIFGYADTGELTGCDAYSLVADEDRARVREIIRRRIAGDTRSVSYEFTALRKDGARIEAGAHGSLAIHDGQPAVVGLVQDISAKKRAEALLRHHVADIETALMSTVSVVTLLSEMRDPYTAGHARQVAQIAVAIGAELDFDSRRQEGLRVAGHLHDLGKMMIPAEILSKPGKLSAVEFALVKGHPEGSYEVLKSVEFPWPVAQVALQHHERMDGGGYPQCLKGEEILLEARIMAVADVVEAMASHRPYRPGLGINIALAEIERGRGTSYDARVADSCLKLFREKGFQLPRP